jgi:hypothetical protein
MNQHTPQPGPTVERKHRRRNEALGVIALLAGLAALGALAAASEQDDEADPFTRAAEAFQDAAPRSTETCCESLTLTYGAGGTPAAGEANAFGTLLGSLGFTRATLDRMMTTRALDGTQTAESDHAVMWWTYHPDDGLQVILEPN